MTQPCDAGGLHVLVNSLLIGLINRGTFAARHLVGVHFDHGVLMVMEMPKLMLQVPLSTQFGLRVRSICSLGDMTSAGSR